MVVISCYSVAPTSALKAVGVRLPSPPLHLALSAGDALLSVCLSQPVNPRAVFTVLIYDTAQLAQVGGVNL